MTTTSLLFQVTAPRTDPALQSLPRVNRRPASGREFCLPVVRPLPSPPVRGLGSTATW
jgi:hypothetical protein